MNNKYIALIFLLTCALVSGCNQELDSVDSEPNQVPVPTGTDILNFEGSGFIPYTDYDPLSDKPVNLWFHVPKDNPSDIPILIVFHGTNRNANDYRNVWREFSEQYQVLLIAPEFSDQSFPGSAMYNLGNMYDEGGSVNPEEEWTFSIVEPIFDYVTSAVNSNQTSYDIYGHSAGSQFVHRFLTFKQDTRVNRSVAANAGWYTFTDFGVQYPYGLANSPATQAGMEKALQKSMIVLLGEEDTERDSNLRQNAEADQQGPHRLARGMNYFDRAAELAQEYQVNFNWSLEEVPGVGHTNAGMAPAAAALLYGN